MMEGDAKLQGKRFIWKFTVTLAVLSLHSLLISAARQADPKVPILAQKPLKEQIHLVNTTVKLTCKVKGQPRPFLNWFKDGVLLDERQNRRYIINRYSLVIQNIQVTDAGTYGCRAQNKFGETWGNATIRVVKEKLSDQYKDYLKGSEGRPIFSPNKDDSLYVAMPVTQDIQLDCDARGNPSPTITWLKDGVKVDCDDDDSSCEIDGFKLKINNLILKDAGNYTCIVENKFGHISWSFIVEVLQRMPLAPLIEGPINQTVTVGEDARFECKILISDTKPQMQWLRHYMVNGSYTNEDGEPYVQVLQQSGFNKNIGDPQVLIIRNVKQEEAGWYTCLVANTIGINYVSAWLTVINEDTDFKEQTHYVNTTVKLVCKVEWKPSSLLNWFKDGVLLDARENERYIINRFSLVIQNIQMTDAGTYGCRAQNQYGEAWRNATIRVVEEKLSDRERMPLAPLIEGPINQTVTVGEDARFECKVLISDTKAQIQWLHHYMVHGSYTDEEGEPYVKVLQQSGLNKNIGDPHILVIRNVKQEDAGWYSCLVVNTVGVNYVSAWLTVINEDTAYTRKGEEPEGDRMGIWT